MADDDTEDATSEDLLARYVAEGKAQRRAAAEKAFTAVYHRHHDGVRGFIQVRLGGQRPFISQGGDEICADAWIDIARSAGSFQGRSKFFTWACAIALRRLLKHVRAARASRSIQAPFDEEDRQPILDDAPDREPPVPVQVEEREFSRELEAAVMRLDENLRSVFVLRAKDGLDWRDIEDITGTPVSTLHYQMRRAVQSLGPLLRGHLSEEKP